MRRSIGNYCLTRRQARLDKFRSYISSVFIIVLIGTCFPGEAVFAVARVAITGQMIVATVHLVGVTYGEPIVDVKGWVCFKNGDKRISDETQKRDQE